MEGEKGFTLVELILVIVIVGIVSSIAVPWYVHYSNESRYTEAYVYVDDIKLTQKMYYLKYHQYFSALTFEEFKSHGIDVSEAQYFDFNVVGDEEKFVITAISIGYGLELIYDSLVEFDEPQPDGKKKGHFKTKKKK